MVIVVIAVVINLSRGRDAFTPEQVKEIASIKAEAERLAIEENWPGACEISADRADDCGAAIRESAVWSDRAAKADQDRGMACCFRRWRKDRGGNAAARDISWWEICRRRRISVPNCCRRRAGVAVVSTQRCGWRRRSREMHFDISGDESRDGTLTPALARFTCTPGDMGFDSTCKGFGDQAIAPPAEAVTDEQIGQAIQKGVTFLRSFKADQIAIDKQIDKTQLEGMNALVVCVAPIAGDFRSAAEYSGAR